MEKCAESVSVPDQVLRDFGCVRCVWKQHLQCPKGFTLADERVKEGCCDEMADFLLELRRTSISLSGMKEKFFLYTQEMQAMADKMRYHELLGLRDEIAKDLSIPSPEKKRKLSELGMAITEYKMWWVRLTELVVKGLGRVGDREGRSKDLQDSPRQITVQQLNVLMRDAREYLEGPEGKR